MPNLGGWLPMGVLRLICCCASLLGALAFAPGPARGQAAGVVEVTSSIIGADGALEASEQAAALLHVVPLDTAPVAPLDEEQPDVQISVLAPAISLRPIPRDTWAVPTARWDDHPNGARWTAAVLSALRGPGAPLLETEPTDIHRWCPGYLEATPAQRAAFWTGLISTLAWHESTHNPRAVGGGGQWFGLVQIAPGTARWRNCDVGSGEALLNGASNLRCGVRIMAITVPRDNVVSEGMRGVAADWGPFHSSRKREDMRNWVRQQEYCELPPARTRPVIRPEGLGEAAVAVPDPRPLRPMPRPQRL